MHASCLVLSRCICGILKKSPRILVTHQLQYLEAADQILVLKEVCSFHSFSSMTAYSPIKTSSLTLPVPQWGILRLLACVVSTAGSHGGKRDLFRVAEVRPRLYFLA